MQPVDRVDERMGVELCCWGYSYWGGWNSATVVEEDFAVLSEAIEFFEDC